LDENPVLKRLAGRLPLHFASAFLTFKKSGIVQRLLHELKYGNKPEVGYKLGKLYGVELAQSTDLSSVDLIVPVPLHEVRQRQRGYNQSAMFASGLSETLGVPWHETVTVRVHSTSTQTRKSRKERWQNVTDAFSVSSNAHIKNKHLLLVDDVITTGATLEACGMHLLEKGCGKLSIACIAAA
jgi:ComF family protein